MTVALPATTFAVAPAGKWRRAIGVLVAATAALLVLFRRDVGDLAHIWWTSTTFGHCLFIGPVVAWLVWQRRCEVAELEPTGWAPGLVLVAAGGAGWLVGDASGVALARHLGLVMMVQGAVVTVLGPHVARGLLFPLSYAFFLVPFGEGLEPPLQTVTVAMVMPLLHLAGVPAQVEGVLITIPNGWFEVAEACSGAKFVIAMVAFGALVANVGFTRWRRRMWFMVAAVIVPVLANGLRAFGTIYAAHLTSVARATGFDHIVYGWLFFGLVMAAVLAIGWRWFDRSPDDPAFDPAALPPPSRGRLPGALAAVLVVATAALFPAWSSAVASRSDALPARLDLPTVAGWHRVAMSAEAPWTPYYPAADHFLIGRYADGAGDAVDLAVAVFASQREGHELVAFGTGVLREDDRWVRISDLPPIAGGAAMRITTTGALGRPVQRVVATWYRVADTSTSSDKRVKLEALRARLLGGRQRAIAIHLSAIATPGHDPVVAIERLRAALGEPGEAADRLLDRR